MAHIAKYTKAAAGHMNNHYARSELYHSVKRSNENIDPSRTHLNYNLAAELQPLRPGQYMAKRLSEVRCQKREDVNIMCDWVITEPKELLHRNRDREFFEAAYEFLRDRYGSENVLSSYVHMDEVTPHMHFSFIPIIEDKKRGGEKVSAKEVINRTELKRFHPELQQHLEQTLGCRVPVLNEATAEGNKSIEELKRQSATERLHEANETASEIVSKANEISNAINSNLKAKKAEYEALKANCEIMTEYVKGIRDRTKWTIDNNIGKVVTRGVLHKQENIEVPKKIWDDMQSAAAMAKNMPEIVENINQQFAEFARTSSAGYTRAIREENRAAKDKIRNLEEEIDTLKIKLAASAQAVDEVYKKINKVLSKLPNDTAQQFIDAWKAPERQKLIDDLTR